jgi:hypothetical protein
MRKNTTLLLIAILVSSSLVMVGSAFAQSTTKPSVPEFAVKFVNASYTVTTTNSYTGVDETEQVSNNSIEIAIANPPFDFSGYQLYYNVRVKPHFEDNWTEVYPVRNRTSSYGDTGFSYAEYINDDSPPQSKSSYTIVAYSVVPTELYLASGYDIKRYYSGADGQEGESFAFLYAIPYGGQVDFQVEVLVGHEAQVYVNDHPLAPYPIGHYEQSVAFDISSGWSDTQTITIGESQTSTSSPEPTTPTSPTPLPSEEPQLAEQELILGVAVTAAVVCVGLSLLLYLIKRK